jgi:hypothetical protein
MATDPAHRIVGVAVVAEGDALDHLAVVLAVDTGDPRDAAEAVMGMHHEMLAERRIFPCRIVAQILAEAPAQAMPADRHLVGEDMGADILDQRHPVGQILLDPQVDVGDEVEPVLRAADRHHHLAGVEIGKGDGVEAGIVPLVVEHVVDHEPRHQFGRVPDHLNRINQLSRRRHDIEIIPHPVIFTR